MTATECEQLDDYLDGELDESAARVFDEHLAACADCRSAAAQSSAVNHVLRAAFVIPQRAEHVPRSRATRARAARQGVVAAVAALAAGLLLWAAWPLLTGKEPELAPPRGNVAQGEGGSPHATPASPDPDQPKAHVASEPDMLAVPMPSRRQNVTIVWMYPTVRSQP